MLFWIAVSLLATAVTYWVTRPLMGRGQDSSPVQNPDTAVYKDQLAEVDRDLARGAISTSEADAARAEVARRLIRAGAESEDRQAGPETANSALRKPVYAAATLALPLLSLALYLTAGRPDLPGNPLSERLAAAPEKSKADDLVAQVEARLREHPDDGKGWDVIAPVYASLGRNGDAAEAYAKAAKLLGETTKRLEGFAMADIRAANGVVSEAAKSALTRSLALDPNRAEPKIWLALAKEQDGKLDEAKADYAALIKEAPADAPWAKAVAARLKGIEERQGGGAPAAAEPKAAGGDGLAGMKPEERAMVEKMVAGLASRLKENGNDLEGWLRLLRALKVMGRDAEAQAALNDARKQFPNDEKARAEIEGLAKSLGLGS